MFSQVLNRKASFIASLAAVAVVGTGAIAPASQAATISLVPQQEGEVDLDNLACLTATCFTLDDSIFSSVTSEIDSSTQTRSYLFVDAKGTKNTYNDLVNGGTFTFGIKDLGTTEPEKQFWFRPVAVNPNGTLIEKGQLEVGTFTFEFAKVLSSLNLSFFDTEKENGTSFEVFYADNTSQVVTVAKGPDSNIQDFAFNNVSKIRLNLGERSGATGDGVTFQGTASVPEPGMVLGATVAAIAGIAGRRRQQAAPKA